MTISLENFEYIKARGEELYKSFEPVKCPYFNELVYFNLQGLQHLKLRKSGVERIAQDQHMRFKLLHLAPLILKITRTLQGHSVRKGFERLRSNNKTTWVVVERNYYEFIAIVDGIRVRVVVKKIDDGQLYFWSIIPYWTGDAKKRFMHFGNPEED